MTDETLTPDTETIPGSEAPQGESIILTGSGWPTDPEVTNWPMRGDVVDAVWRSEVGSWVFTHEASDLEYYASLGNGPFAARVATEEDIAVQEEVESPIVVDFGADSTGEDDAGDD